MHLDMLTNFQASFCCGFHCVPARPALLGCGGLPLAGSWSGGPVPLQWCIPLLHLTAACPPSLLTPSPALSCPPRLPACPPQAQQQSMGQMVSAVLERNAELSEEVAALRRQMAGLAGRRADFLWL